MTDTSNPIPIPDAPNPGLVILTAATFRHVLSGLGAVGVMWGSQISDSNLAILAGSVVWLGTLGWSVWQKYGQRKKVRETAILSAQTGTPVQPGPSLAA